MKKLSFMENIRYRACHKK